MIAHFCREYGYGLNIEDTSFSGVLAGVSSGKSDIGAACITITEERKESMLFSDPNYTGGAVIVVKSNDAASNTSAVGKFINRAEESFKRTFISENRWKMFLSGIGVTLLITLSSAIFGTLLGGLLFML